MPTCELCNPLQTSSRCGGVWEDFFRQGCKLWHSCARPDFLEGCEKLPNYPSFWAMLFQNSSCQEPVLKCRVAWLSCTRGSRARKNYPEPCCLGRVGGSGPQMSQQLLALLPAITRKADLLLTNFYFCK